MKYCFYLLSLSILVSCGKQGQIASPNFTAKTQLLDSLGQRYAAANRFSGTILVAQNEKLLYHRYLGLADYETERPFTSNTAFKIGEVSQYFIAQVIRELEKADEIKLSDQVSLYLPKVKKAFTIGQVVSNEAGLPKDIKPDSSQADLKTTILDQVNAATLDLSQMELSDLGYQLLALLIESVTELPFEMALQKYLEAYQLANTFYQKTNQETAQAYAGFNNKNGNGLERERIEALDSEKIFSSQGLKATAEDVWTIMQHQQEVDLHGYLSNDGFSYGVSKKQDGQIIIVLSNYRHPVAKEMVSSIQAILHEEPFELPLLRIPAAINKDLLQDYEGLYEINPSFTFEITSTEDSLYVLMFGQKSPIIPQAADQFFLIDNDASMRFVRDSIGQVFGVMLYDGFLEGNLVKKLK